MKKLTHADERQGMQYYAETHWFHMFRDMVDSGDLAGISSSAIKIYIVIKSHSNYSSGRAFPALDNIAEKSGISLPQVRRCIKELEDKGYLCKSKIGRRNEYRLREKVRIINKENNIAKVAVFDYIAKNVKNSIAEIEEFIKSKELSGTNFIHIENLINININNVANQDHSIILNTQLYLEEMRSLLDKSRQNERAAGPGVQHQQKALNT